jgi:DNA-directed RNA polymerase subunit RPC12/RpoP
MPRVRGVGGFSNACRFRGADRPARGRMVSEAGAPGRIKTTHPYTDSWECAACGAPLVPLTPPVIGDDARPHLKCPKCGQAYRWLETADWPPLGDD